MRLPLISALAIAPVAASLGLAVPTQWQQASSTRITDNDWRIVGNGMVSERDHIGIGGMWSSDVTAGVYTDDDDVKVALSAFKQSSPTQVGTAIAIQGVARDFRGSGIGVSAFARSSEMTANCTGIRSISDGTGNANIGISTQVGGNPTILASAITAVAASETDVQYGVQAVSGLSPQPVRLNSSVRAIGYGNDLFAGNVNYGVRGEAYPGLATQTNIGGSFIARRPPSGIAGNPDTNYGGYFFADNDGAINRAGYFAGDVEVTGMLITSSDRKLKTDIESMGSSSHERILKLNPRSYRYRQDVEEMALPSGVQFGFVAQELEQEFPNLVRDSVRPPVLDVEGNTIAEAYSYKSVNYTGLIPILVQSIQEQDREIELLKDELSQLRRDIDGLKRSLRR